jgi:hypothetical protein
MPGSPKGTNRFNNLNSPDNRSLRNRSQMAQAQTPETNTKTTGS